MRPIEGADGWQITDTGLEHNNGYVIDAEELWESDWLSHMGVKSWVNFNEFWTALTEARLHFYGLEEFWDEVTKEDYLEYLKSERWKKLRLIVLERCNHQCQTCTNTKHLQVHHRTYERVGHELLTDLGVLCRGCHSKISKKKKR